MNMVGVMIVLMFIGGAPGSTAGGVKVTAVAIGTDSDLDALGALARFRKVTRRIGTRRLRTVATAAVRDANNGADFLAACSKLGIRPALISGEEEAVGAAYGVLSSFPRAGGIVAELRHLETLDQDVADHRDGAGEVHRGAQR